MTRAPSEDSDQPGHPPSRISLRCPHEEALGPQLPKKCTATTLIRGAQVILMFCHATAILIIRVVTFLSFKKNRQGKNSKYEL